MTWGTLQPDLRQARPFHRVPCCLCHKVKGRPAGMTVLSLLACKTGRIYVMIIPVNRFPPDDDHRNS